MKPIAHGRAAILGNITVQESEGETREYERSILVVFDSIAEFRKAVEYGAIEAPMGHTPSEGGER